MGLRDYLQCIPLSSEELYHTILTHRLNYQQLKDSGYPTADPRRPDKVILSCSPFNSQDPAKQICRCGKEVSLLENDWYEDEDGCSYHTGKRIFCDGPENGLYNCCKGISDTDGCVKHQWHVSSFRQIYDTVFINTKFKTGNLFKSSNVFGLDCEMVFTTCGIEVVKVSLVSIGGDVVYDSLVQPTNLVLDFNTAFSGVCAEDLNGVTTTLIDVQACLLNILNKNSILIGHGLENDLLGLHLLHRNIIDTSILFTHERGFPFRYSLKHLASKYLNKTIHGDTIGHNSVEDAKICLELILRKVYLDVQDKSPSASGNDFCYRTGFNFPYNLATTNTFAFGFPPWTVLHWQNFVHHAYQGSVSYRTGLQINVQGNFGYEIPVFPIVPPPSLFCTYPMCN